MNFEFKLNFHRVKLTLGKHYVVTFYKQLKICKFIKVTAKGYNLLDLDSNICFLRKHVYPIKHKGEPTEMFWVHNSIGVFENKNLNG